MKAPGSLVRLYYDGWVTLEPGDYLRTGTTGRLYRVETCRVQQKGKHRGRQHIMATVMRSDHKPEQDARVAPIYWYGRGRQKGSRPLR